MKDVGNQKLEHNNSFIRLSLRKPREWKVALTTSVSSPAIVPPVIQLWDAERGSVLVDTSQTGRGAAECVRSKSASFTRRGAEGVHGRGCNKIKREVQTTTLGRCKETVRQNRSKSLSNRQDHEEMVSPGDCVRPRTPVMVARRISLNKDNSCQSLPVERSCSADSTRNSGITTHHRKQHSDSLVCSSPRRVKNNVSFGRVDTIDDTSGIYSSFSLMRSRGTSNIKSTDSERSTPKITITEVVDSSNKSSEHSKSGSKRDRSKQRSHSGIPVLVKGQKDSSSNCSLEGRLRGGHDPKVLTNNDIQNDRSSRKFRKDTFTQNQTNKHKVSPVRVFHLPEPPPLLPPSAFLDMHPNCQCNRGNCPLAKYSPQELDQVKSMSRREDKGISYDKRHKHSNILQGTSHVSNSYVKMNDKNSDNAIRNVVKQTGSHVYERSKTRKKRVASRSRLEVVSSSSSDGEERMGTRHPPWRKRQARNTKGDRLVGVNGQLVKTPQEAEELLRAGGDVVRLHLQRTKDAGVSQSLSLPRRALDKDKTMGSNMSRHSGKGLTGRRSQSSGNLCNGKAPAVARIFSPCGRDPRDRYKLCGSLPNHLDSPPPSSDVLLRLQPLPPPPPAPDQGYASERSPEDELPPTGTCPVHHPAATSKPLYPFLHNNSTFTVRLSKGTRGLGLSVTGGVDTEEPWPGLIRVKRLFPHQPAWQSGQLAHGDFLLVANNTSLVGLTNYEALEVLRTTPTEVVLTVCRPPPELQVLSAPPPDSAPLPPRRDTVSSSSHLLPLKRVESFGEFELTLKKVNGSLGFTLRKEDESVLGHYVRALVREPALSDGRIKPGDKIVAVNGVDMSPLSHEEAVLFLRQCGQEVHLKLYRDPAQTPVQALSPTEHHRTFKPILRKEAQDMLTDLAVKKSLSPNESSGSSNLSMTGHTSSPRKRRLAKTPSPDHAAERPENHLSWSDEVLERVTPGFENEKPRRPDSLNFSADRKPHFQFSTMSQSKNNESLNSMDDLDSCGSLPGFDSELGVGPLPLEPVSMPPLLTSTSDSAVGFSYRNPAYRSANPAPSKSKSSLSEVPDLAENRSSDNDLAGNVNSESCVEGSKGLLKWKGVVFTPEDGADTATSPEDSISQITEVDNSNQVLVVELNRGWNSRLGFSLQQSGRNTLISAIHSDSVASRDGRLMVGDQLIMVNDESVEGMSTSEVINLLRKIRGSICITIWRKST